ncbi:hypothetical protein BH18ACT4_BH18ACT4_14220 [soil metagenome]
MEVDPADERPHEPGPDPGWREWWYFDFAAPDGGLGGYVRLDLHPHGRYWACLVGPGLPLVTVVDHDVALPRSRRSLEVRADGLWADHICETPLDHWTVANEAFAVALDDPAEAYGAGRGERVPVGFDLEWESDGAPWQHPGGDGYEVPCLVHGEILVGDERIDFSGHGQRSHAWGVRDWWSARWCWVAGRLDDGLRFQADNQRRAGGAGASGRVQSAAGAAETVTGLRADADYDRHGIPLRATMTIEPPGLELGVMPLASAPVLVAAADGRLSRVARALCRFEAADGRTGHGWAEWNQPA